MHHKTRFTLYVRSRSRTVKVVLLACVLALSLPAVAYAQGPEPPPVPDGCQLGSLPSHDPRYPDDQLILICIPPGTLEDPLVNWNGQLVVYAHGYVARQADLDLPWVELGTFPTLLPDLMGEGFAFATTSYHKNGYAVEQAGEDINALVRYFKTHVLPRASLLDKVFVVGASEGGLITTMLVEKHPDIYDGGLAMCGPIGGMPYQLQYLADFRVVFDYFFPGVLPGNVAEVPPEAWQAWETVHVPAIIGAFSSNPLAAGQLFNVIFHEPYPGDPIDTAGRVLYYSIWGTNDLLATAGGMPYGNQDTIYWGSYDDAALNAGVDRVESDGRARAYVRRAYQPTGELAVPLVTLHNLVDPAVPYQHEILYYGKAAPSGLFFPLMAAAPYGHCLISHDEFLGAFTFLVSYPGP